MEKTMDLDFVGESAQKYDKENQDWRWCQIKPC